MDVGDGVDTVDDAPHHADVGVRQAEIGGENDGRRGHVDHGKSIGRGSVRLT